MNSNLRNCLTTVLSLAFILFIVGCGKENVPNNNGGETGGENPPAVKSITISSQSGTSLKENTKATFVVKDDSDKDITSSSEVYVNGNKISGASYVFENKGSYEVYAKYNTLTSNKITIYVREESTSSATEFTSKVIVHEFTGTWCGYCAGPLLEVYEKAEKFGANFIAVEIHSGGSGNSTDGVESYDFPNNKVFKVDGLPTVWYNFDKNFNFYPSEDIEKYVAKKIKTGLSIDYDLDGGNVVVNIKSDKTINGNKIVVYLLEEKLVSNQYNYENNDPSSKAYQKGDVIKDFEYNNVARASLTKSALGDSISSASGSEHSMTFSLDGKLKNVKDKKNTKVVAFLLKEDGTFINAQSSKANEFQDFD